LYSVYDAEDIDEQIHRIEGKLRLRIQEVGCDGLSPAQERSLDYLLDHEEEVLDAIAESQFRVFREFLTDELDFRSEFGMDYAVQLPRDITSTEQLKQMMSFSYVEIEGDAIDGFVRIHLSGACDWDEEHGFSLDLLKDRVLGWDEEEDGFPATVPESVNLSEFLPADGSTRPVEFQIYGRWSGIYQIDRDGMVVDRRHCMLCPGSHWDPEGVEDVRIPEASHLKLATNPFAMALPSLVLAGGCLAPLLLVFGFLIWGGFYWGALGFSVVEFVGRAIHPFLRKESKPGAYLRAAVVIAVSIAGIVYWQKGGAAGPNKTFVTVIGWIVWAISAYAFLTAVKNSVLSLLYKNHPDNPLPLTIAWPNILFSIVVGVALWKTYTGDVSKLHLIWAVPATFLICLLFGIRRLMNQVRSMGGKWQDRFFQSSHKNTYVIDPEDVHRHHDDDDEDKTGQRS
ncbi:MAG TPA: hypothetical protein VLA12_21015, partial [Planctomycetaceae bacterium]|nr:hypothetical protein [Planctomycetaceae bacterium]